VERFIAACHVPAAAIERTLGHALDIASASGSALLRIEITPTGATVTASAPPVAALVPLAVPEPDGVPLAAVPDLSPVPETRRAPVSPRLRRDAAATGGASARHQHPEPGGVPLRRASDRGPAPAGSALPEPL
jgi:hypothetical protein